jgi:hypothetical protein
MSEVSRMAAVVVALVESDNATRVERNISKSKHLMLQSTLEEVERLVRAEWSEISRSEAEADAITVWSRTEMRSTAYTTTKCWCQVLYGESLQATPTPPLSHQCFVVNLARGLVRLMRPARDVS